MYYPTSYSIACIRILVYQLWKLSCCSAMWRPDLAPMQKASQLSKQHGFPSIEQVWIPHCIRRLRHSSLCLQSKWNQISRVQYWNRNWMNWKSALSCWTQAWQLNAIISNQFNWILSQLIYKICTPDSASPTDLSICRWMGALIARVTLSGNKWDFSVDCATRSWHSQLIWWILLLIFNFSVWVAQLPRLPRGAPVSFMKFKFRIPKKEKKTTRIMHSAYEILQSAASIRIQIEIQIHIWNVNRIKLKIDRLTRVTRIDSEARFKAWYNAALRVFILHPFYTH